MSGPDHQRGPQTAWVMNGPGTPVVAVERPVDEPAPGQVLVKVKASSLNFHDNVNLMGLLPGPWPRVPMSDGAGEVVAVGPGVDGLRIGQRVMGAFHPGWLDGPPTPAAKRELPGDSGDGWLQQCRGFGVTEVIWGADQACGGGDAMLLQAAVAAAAGLVRTPDHLSDTEAATIPCAAVTAWSALVEAEIGKGDVVV